MSRQITPTNLAGWIALAIWGAGLGLLIWSMSLCLRSLQDPIYRAGAVGLCVVAKIVWIIGGILWMKARSEIVDADALYDRQKERNRDRTR